MQLAVVHIVDRSGTLQKNLIPIDCTPAIGTEQAFSLCMQVDSVQNSLLDAFDVAEDHKEEYYVYREMLLDDQHLDIEGLLPAFKAKVGHKAFFSIKFAGGEYC